MLKGISKVAYIMLVIYKNIDKVPPELCSRALMSDFNDAMRLLAAANFDMDQHRVHHYMSMRSQLKNPCIQMISTDISIDTISCTENVMLQAN